MKVMQIEGEWSAGHIRRAERPQPKPGPGEVLLKMEAASLNFRDTVLVRRGYHTGRSTITVRARARIEEHSKGRFRILVSEIPFQQARDRVEERIAALVNEDRIKGISAIRNESDLKEPVRLVLELKRDADPDVHRSRERELIDVWVAR